MKRKLIVLVASCAVLLSACGDVTGNNQTTTTDTSTSEKAKATTSQLSKDYYRTVINDGQYKVSQSRGVSLSLNSGYNIKAFETGLMSLSHSEFPTDSYYFQEGQQLDAETISKWIKRSSGDNPEPDLTISDPEGLNPVDNGELEPDKRAPKYLSQILEQNYMVKDGDNFKLAGISIGLAMNSVDYYQKVQYGAEFKTDIQRANLEAEGKKMANEIVARLRKMEGLGNLPITVGLFEQTAKDSLAGGVFFSEGVSKDGAATVANWKDINEKKVIFPRTDGETSNETTSFENFKSQVQSFFPNLNGVTAEATYSGDQLIKMKATVTTQFYGQSEIIALTQHVSDNASKYLPPNIPIEISINSIDGMEAFLNRDSGEKEFQSHVFD